MGYDVGAVPSAKRQRMPRISRPALPFVALALAASLCACGTTPTYTRAEAPRTLAEVESDTAAFDNAAWSDVPVTRAAELRSRALATMRRRDASATLIADILTTDFPPSSGVPALIEETTVDGVPAWVVVEVYGAGEGNLERWRLWVLARPGGRIISSSTYR